MLRLAKKSVILLVAYITADREALLSIFSDPGKFYSADPYTFLFASVLILIFGAGAFSIDGLLAWVWRKKSEAEAGAALEPTAFFRFSSATK